ncbi:MAG: enoyl-CoA hydratase/isomerase family protein [Pseudomonadales bacterium]
MSDEAPIVSNVLPCTNGQSIGTLLLNVPATLNSLTLDMVELLLEPLEAWQNDDSIAAVFIYGSGEKAFCAGGDVQALHKSAVTTPGGPCEYAETFFAREYRMNHTLHNYSKPVVCWGHGIVMGGGLGIFAGCSHRVVTERTRFAMPEVTIALFPDVGGSYFLNKMPGAIGRFLALTAANFNGTDGVFTGFGTVMLANEARDSALSTLQALDWQSDAEGSADLVSSALAELSTQNSFEVPDGFIAKHQLLINELCEGDIKDVYTRIAELETEDSWLCKARDAMKHGSPLAVLWIDRQLSAAKELSLADALRSELLLATNIVRHPEFAEGVRALLIDKDRSPNWQFKAPEEVPGEVLDGFFASPWAQNPLADL